MRLKITVSESFWVKKIRCSVKGLDLYFILTKLIHSLDGLHPGSLSWLYNILIKALDTHNEDRCNSTDRLHRFKREVLGYSPKINGNNVSTYPKDTRRGSKKRVVGTLKMKTLLRMSVCVYLYYYTHMIIMPRIYNVM